MILEPNKPMTRRVLLGIAAYINEAIRWRFSYGRMVTPDRLMHFDIPELDLKPHMDVGQIMPQPRPSKIVSVVDVTTLFKPTALTDLFTSRSGDYHKAESLPDGPYPLISCGDKDNGLVRFCAAPPHHIYENCLTVAYNGSPMVTKYHPYKFIAKDDVAVLIPKSPLRGTTLLFVQMMLLRETWRYSYGRKCFKEKLTRTVINLPVKDGEIDEESMQEVMWSTAYWGFIQPRVRDVFSSLLWRPHLTISAGTDNTGLLEQLGFLVQSRPEYIKKVHADLVGDQEYSHIQDQSHHRAADQARANGIYSFVRHIVCPPLASTRCATRAPVAPRPLVAYWRNPATVPVKRPVSMGHTRYRPAGRVNYSCLRPHIQGGGKRRPQVSANAALPEQIQVPVINIGATQQDDSGTGHQNWPVGDWVGTPF